MSLLTASLHPQRLLRVVQGQAMSGRMAVIGGLVGLSVAFGAQAKIYTCNDAHGHRLTSDRPIPECLDSEQRVLNKDGSQRQIVPPA